MLILYYITTDGPLTPFFIMIALEGFIQSSVVIVWSMMAPLTSLLIVSGKQARKWFFAFLVLVLIWGLTSSDAVGLIHGDFGILNIFVNEDQDISIFDFDLCGYGLKAFDIATFQVFLPRENEDPIQINAFVKGYNKIRRISQEEETAIKLFKNFIRTIWGMGYYITLAPILGLEYFEGELDPIILGITNRLLKELENIPS